MEIDFCPTQRYMARPASPSGSSLSVHNKIKRANKLTMFSEEVEIWICESFVISKHRIWKPWDTLLPIVNAALVPHSSVQFEFKPQHTHARTHTHTHSHTLVPAVAPCCTRWASKPTGEHNHSQACESQVRWVLARRQMYRKLPQHWSLLDLHNYTPLGLPPPFSPFLAEIWKLIIKS